MEITIDKADIQVMLGCERDVFEKNAKSNLTVYITSNTNIDIEKLSKFARACHSKKQKCKLILKRGEESDRLYVSEKIY